MSNAKAAISQDANSKYRIAAVSRATGIPIATIRIWEHRYSAVQPMRSATNNRLYSRDDIERLAFLKSMVDEGHAIGTIAALSNEQIGARLRGAVPLPSAATGAWRFVLVGAYLPSMLAVAWDGRADIQVANSFASLKDMEGGGVVEIDALVVEAPILKPELVTILRNLRSRTGVRVVVVVYAFASTKTLARLDKANIIALADPVDPSQIARICELGLSAGVQPSPVVAWQFIQPVKPPRYSDNYLMTLSRLPTTVKCECPNHLATLITRVTTFERYSLECESLNAADASVHALLYSAAGHCREILEVALQRVIEDEGIAPPETPMSE
jgi:hypothetical protein